MEKLINPRTVQTTFHVRYAETDAMRIVHHSTYIVWFEEARSALLRAPGTSYVDFEAEGVSLAVSAADVRYIAPAKYDDLVTIQAELTDLKSRKMTFQYTVIHTESGRKLATGTTHHICINHNGQTTRIPKRWLEQWQTV